MSVMFGQPPSSCQVRASAALRCSLLTVVTDGSVHGTLGQSGAGGGGQEGEELELHLSGSLEILFATWVSRKDGYNECLQWMEKERTRNVCEGGGGKVFQDGTGE